MGFNRYYDSNPNDFSKDYSGISKPKKTQKQKLLDIVWESMKAGKYRFIINTKTKKKTLQVW